MAEPTITLALLSRNRPDCLRAALTAAFAGTSMPDEIIISDDSDDEAASSVQTVACEFPGVSYVRGPRRGLGANENNLIAHTTCDWFVVNGDDARIAPDFIANLRRWISQNACTRAIPSGYEIRNEELCRPSRLDFFGYQRVPYVDYDRGRALETIVVQATAFPMEALRNLRWLEVSLYGTDEVDMAYKFQKLGYRIVFTPELLVYHNQSDVGRVDYPMPVQISRLYVLLRIYSIYQPSYWRFILFATAAPWQLLYAFARRRLWRRCAEIPRVTCAAYTAFLRSLWKDWRTC